MKIVFLNSIKNINGNEEHKPYWNYRIIEEKENNRAIFKIIEAYYDKNGNIESWMDAIYIPSTWDNIEELKRTYDILKNAFELPLLKRDKKGDLYQP